MTFSDFIRLSEAVDADIIVGELTIPKDEIDLSFARSGGPGGQNVNKVNSKAILHWNVMGSRCWLGRWELRDRFVQLWKKRITKDGVLVISSQAERDQLQNIYNCLGKLRQMMEETIKRTKQRVPTQPTQGSQKRRLEDKDRRQRLKQQRRNLGIDF